MDPDPDSDPNPDSDPDPAIYVSDLHDGNKILNFFKTVFLLITFRRYGTFTSIFKDEKSKRIHKTVGTKVYLTIYA